MTTEERRLLEQMKADELLRVRAQLDELRKLNANMSTSLGVLKELREVDQRQMKEIKADMKEMRVILFINAMALMSVLALLSKDLVIPYL